MLGVWAWVAQYCRGLRKTQVRGPGTCSCPISFLFIYFINYLKKETDNALFSAAFNFFISKYLKKTPQNLSKPHIDLKTKTQLNKKKTKTRLFFFHTYL